MRLKRTLTEAFDAGEDVVGALGPGGRLWQGQGTSADGVGLLDSAATRGSAPQQHIMT